MGWFRIIEFDISDETIVIPDDSDGLLVIKPCKLRNIKLIGGMTQLVIRAPCELIHVENDGFGADAIIVSSSNVSFENCIGHLPRNLVNYNIRHPDWIQIVCIDENLKPVSDGFIENITINNSRLYAPDDPDRNYRGVQGIVAFDCEVRNVHVTNTTILSDIDEHGISFIKPVGCSVDGVKIKSISGNKKPGIVFQDRKGIGSGYGNLITNTECELIDVSNTTQFNVRIIENNKMTNQHVFNPEKEFNSLLSVRDTSVYNPKTGRLYRAFGMNNPCNIMDFNLGWAGTLDDQSLYTEDQKLESKRVNGDRLVIFTSPIKGFRAAAIDLQNKQTKYSDCKNIRGIMSRYAPKSAGNPNIESYIWHIADKLGVTDKQVISVRDYDVMHGFLTAITEFENGRVQPYTDDIIRQGIIEAGIQLPEERDSRVKPVSKSKTISHGTVATATTVATAGIEVYKDSSEAPIDVTEVVEFIKTNTGNIEAVKEYVINNSEKIDSVLQALNQNSWLEYIQLFGMAVIVFLLVDIILDRRLTSKLGVK